MMFRNVRQTRGVRTHRRMTQTRKSMFCFQCEQTRDTKGCETVGECGKSETVANMQDLLIHNNKGIAQYLHAAQALGAEIDEKYSTWLMESNFSTLTNVNFDESRFETFLERAKELKQSAKDLYKKSGGTEELTGAAEFELVDINDTEALMAQARTIGVKQRQEDVGEDIVGLQELITYGLKGASAYADHARILGKEDPAINAGIVDVFNFLGQKETPTVDQLLAQALAVGKLNLDVMALLDEASTSKYGHPEPVEVPLSPVEGKCILVSGHDLGDLDLILQQTEGTGINVYTHGEMLPAHGYPGLKKYKHLIGNYGNAWQNQNFDFSMFPGPIVMTSNCIIEPRKRYADRIYTRSIVGFPGVQHIEGNDFSGVIEKAQSMKGFTNVPEKGATTTVGFGRNAVMGVADKVIDAVKKGDIKHFFVIGGCDGAEPERSYFGDVARSTPDDSVILTLGCGKYRFLNDNLGTVGETGIPRVLDIGQCNDSYSAIQIASALAGAFETDVNGLPLSFAISWFEQKAVAVLLTLLHLNIKGIILGPNLPAFVTPPVLNVLVEKFGIRPTGDVKEDMKVMLK